MNQEGRLRRKQVTMPLKISAFLKCYLDQIAGERREAIKMIFSPAIFNRDILANGKAGLRETVKECR